MQKKYEIVFIDDNGNGIPSEESFESFDDAESFAIGCKVRNGYLYSEIENGTGTLYKDYFIEQI